MQELAEKSLAGNWLLRLNDLLNKLQPTLKQLRMNLIDRATVRICYDCSRPIRLWDSRVLVTEYTSIHESCWKGRQFFSEFVRYHEAQVSFEPPELLRATGLIESIVCSFYDEVRRNGEGSPQSEYIRGMLNGAKSMLAELRDQATKEQVLSEARRRVGRSFPSIIPLAEDGNRYGWDIEAEAGSSVVLPDDTQRHSVNVQRNPTLEREPRPCLVQSSPQLKRVRVTYADGSLIEPASYGDERATHIALIMPFTNERKSDFQPQVSAARAVIAHITYCDDTPDSIGSISDAVRSFLHFGTWLNERSHTVSFEPHTTHYLVLGIWPLDKPNLCLCVENHRDGNQDNSAAGFEYRVLREATTAIVVDLVIDGADPRSYVYEIDREWLESEKAGNG